jgi:2OG-Fe(II) oxygenase superfamily
MSQVCYRSRDLIIYDDVLSPADFASLFNYLNSVEYQSVHRDGWRKVWRLHDGNPLTSNAGWYYLDVSARRPGERIFPTDTPVDAVVRWIAGKVREIEPIVGAPTAGWCRFSFAPWLYPPGSGLSLHRDGEKYSGAFTYFAHRRWSPYWGGHLLVLDPETAQQSMGAGEQSHFFLGDDEETVRALAPGVGLAVFAKPNRMVFLSPNAQHMVTRVDSNAGQVARVSLAGFFHKDMS